MAARNLRVSPFELDERARRSAAHPAWRYWAALADAYAPPQVVRVVGLG